MDIKKVAVLGGGVMGSQIAAHLANAGIPSYLLDIVPQELTEEEKAKGLTLDSPEVRNRFALKGIEYALNLKPDAFFSKSDVKKITPGNYEDSGDCLKEVDWIVEAVVERIDIKKKVFDWVIAHANPNAIISSNTSGIPLKDLVKDRGQDFQERFLITHFFNPVRYMKLLEIVGGEKTDPQVLQQMARFGEKMLGKGIVYAKDTPNFISNRIGVYGMMATVNSALQMGYSVEEVDKIFGPAMGRPKSATFRTADIAGLDTIVHVSKNLYDAVPEDESRDDFKVPEVLDKMVEKKLLGQKTKQGFYKVVKQNGKKDILSLDLKTLEYKPQEEVRIDSLGAAKNIDDLRERVRTVVYAKDRAGKLAWKVTADTLAYTARRVPEISDDIVNIDNGMKWGYNWKLGPFETWDAIGVSESVKRMEEEGRQLPDWVKALAAEGGTFYRQKDGQTSYYDIPSRSYKTIPERAEFIVLENLKARNKVIKENASASLVDLGDGVACLEFHSKMNAIDDDILTLMKESVEEVEKNFVGLVVGNQGENFSVGANLMLLLMASRQGEWKEIERIVKTFQDACMRLRYSPKPVVCAPFGMTLGGGAEVAMGGDRIRTHGELYMGLVEVGAGLIPGGGGTKELLLRTLRVTKEKGPFPFVRQTFEKIAFATVSTSAKEAQKLAYLQPEDAITMNRDELLYDAKQDVIALSKSYKQPQPQTEIPLPGPSGRAVLESVIRDLQVAGKISEHDARIGKKLAYVLTGGDILISQKRSEQDLLDLEREAFLSLCGEEKTQARMEHLLTKGKPLRN